MLQKCGVKELRDFLYCTTLHSHIFMGASITDGTIFTSDTKEFHFHKRDFDWLVRNFEYL